jgi:hypothetical protein
VQVVEEKSAANNDNNNHHRLLLATHHARLRAFLPPSPSLSINSPLAHARARALFSRGPAVLSWQVFDPCVGKTEPPKRHFCALLKQGQTFNFVKIVLVVW